MVTRVKFYSPSKIVTISLEGSNSGFKLINIANCQILANRAENNAQQINYIFAFLVINHII